MNEFAARVAEGWKQPISDLEFAALMEDRHVKKCFQRDVCPECSAAFQQARRVVGKVQPQIEAGERLRLAEEGSLHPAGSEHRLQFILRWYWPDGKALDWGADDLDHIRALLDEPPLTDTPPDHFEVIMREHWAGPWQVVPEEEINK